MKNNSKYQWLALSSACIFIVLWAISAMRIKHVVAPYYPLLVVDNEIRVRETGEVLYRFIPVDGGIMDFSYFSNIRDYGKDTSYIVTKSFDSSYKNINSFLIGETPVSQELWSYVMNGKFINPDIKDIIVYIELKPEQWHIFIDSLESKTGCIFNIPTSEQWEYAARGGLKSQNYIYAGSNNIDDVAQYAENTKNKDYVVGMKKAPNELGLFDMSGSVFELTSTRSLDDQKILTHADDSIRQHFNGYIVRGGDVNSVKRFCETRCKAHAPLNSYCGLRLVLQY